MGTDGDFDPKQRPLIAYFDSTDSEAANRMFEAIQTGEQHAMC